MQSDADQLPARKTPFDALLSLAEPSRQAAVLHQALKALQERRSVVG